jgi:hypothetical protein
MAEIPLSGHPLVILLLEVGQSVLLGSAGDTEPAVARILSKKPARGTRQCPVAVEMAWSGTAFPARVGQGWRQAQQNGVCRETGGCPGIERGALWAGCSGLSWRQPLLCPCQPRSAFFRCRANSGQRHEVGPRRFHPGSHAGSGKMRGR